jgi:hypothetical protein
MRAPQDFGEGFQPVGLSDIPAQQMRNQKLDTTNNKF